MKKMLLLSLIMLNSTFLFASSLDEAALALSRGEVTEESLKNNFSKGDFESILERYKAMKLVEQEQNNKSKE